MTDKTIMEEKFNNFKASLLSAESNLKNAENILNEDFVIDGYGYCSSKVGNQRSKLQNYQEDIKNKVIPDIQEL